MSKETLVLKAGARRAVPKPDEPAQQPKATQSENGQQSAQQASIAAAFDRAFASIQLTKQGRSGKLPNRPKKLAKPEQAEDKAQQAEAELEVGADALRKAMKIDQPAGQFDIRPAGQNVSNVLPFDSAQLPDGGRALAALQKGKATTSLQPTAKTQHAPTVAQETASDTQPATAVKAKTPKSAADLPKPTRVKPALAILRRTNTDQVHIFLVALAYAGKEYLIYHNTSASTAKWADVYTDVTGDEATILFAYVTNRIKAETALLELGRLLELKRKPHDERPGYLTDEELAQGHLRAVVSKMGLTWTLRMIGRSYAERANELFDAGQGDAAASHGQAAEMIHQTNIAITKLPDVG